MKKVIFAAILSMPLLSVAQPVTVTLPEKVEVVSVVPRYVTRIVQICTPYQVVKNSPNVNILGTIVGGLLGNQIGGGSGRTAATAVGAVIGSHVGTNNGSKIVEEMRCEDQYEQIQQGDTVTFRYKGRYVTQVFE